MTDIKIVQLRQALLEIIWQFGPRGLSGECCEDLSMPEFFALEHVANTQSCRVQDIGQRLGFTKSGATRIVNRLNKKGYVQKMNSLEDARVCCVTSTEKGRDVLYATHQRYAEMIRKMLCNMPEEYAQKVTEAFLIMAGSMRK
jgi:MarR family transcriptional regulator, organic hydroperoxide resistance regulator